MTKPYLNQEGGTVRDGQRPPPGPPVWIVNCLLARQESFGRISTEVCYEVDAGSADEARAAVRARVLQARPGYQIELIQVWRQPLR